MEEPVERTAIVKHLPGPRVIGMQLVILSICVVAFAGAPVQGGPLPSPLFPPDNWWNLDISSAPLDPASASFINFINSGGAKRLHPDFDGDVSPGSVEIYGFPYIVVDAAQPKKAVDFLYADESDGVDHSTGLSYPFYPIPDEAITQPHWIEGGQPGNIDRRDTDRHMFIVDRDNEHLYELYNVFFNGGRWLAGSGAFFDLKRNDRRPDGWTSADAAGLAMLPGLVRYDEVYGPGEIQHAFRVTVRATNGYVYPASHRAGSNPLALPMGARLRLGAGFDTSGYRPEIQKIFRAMKRHGLIVADNGSDMYVSGTYDTRWNNDILNPAFHSVTAQSFEVVKLGWQPAQATYFPHLAAGGGYTTVVALINTGTGTASATLTLTDQRGHPFRVDISGIGEKSSVPATIPSGAVRTFIIHPATGSDITTAGWASVESTGGSLSGVASFQLSHGDDLRSIAGVLAAQPADSVTIPVDNDEIEERYTGFAVANPASEEIRLRLVLLDSQGNIVQDLAPPSLNPLGPQCQVAVFVHEMIPSAVRFRGSMVLASGNQARFVATALVQNSGLFTAIPVYAGRSASIP